MYAHHLGICIQVKFRSVLSAKITGIQKYPVLRLEIAYIFICLSVLPSRLWIKINVPKRDICIFGLSQISHLKVCAAQFGPVQDNSANGSVLKVYHVQV